MPGMTPLPLRVSAEVSDAIASGRGVVALESTLLSHGLPRESSARTAVQVEAAVRESGAVPATVAVLDGTAHVGLEEGQLVRVAEDPSLVKASVRDLALVTARGMSGATTVASTAHLANLAGVRVFATGGLGGVHRDAHATWDESADLAALAATPVTVVCAGVKSILDVPATLERLETLSVPVLGYRTDVFPGFYVRDTGLPVPWRVDEPEQVAEVVRRQLHLGLRQGVVVANPVPETDEMDRDLHDRTLRSGLAELRRREVSGKDVTPFLLAWFHEQTQGASLATNVALVLANARLAGRIAVAR